MSSPEPEIQREFCKCEKRQFIPQWETLLKNFAKDHKEECQNIIVHMPLATKPLKMMPTGSEYMGTWDVLGMNGKGIYTIPNGVSYSGEFRDGMFHGAGELRYPTGEVIIGKFMDGVMYERTLVFRDGLEYREHNWRYCKMPDRRFTVEYKEGLKPASVSILTADQPTREIPPGYYDTGDGFYDPKTKAVYYPDDLSSIIRSPDLREQRWIIEKCRYAPERVIGPRKDLYEEWSKSNIEPRYIPVPAVPIHETIAPYAIPQFWQKSDGIDDESEYSLKSLNISEDSRYSFLSTFFKK